MRWHNPLFDRSMRLEHWTNAAEQGGTKGVVWQSVLSDAAHTIEVVNQATAGHPRIDLDLALR